MTSFGRGGYWNREPEFFLWCKIATGTWIWELRCKLELVDHDEVKSKTHRLWRQSVLPKSQHGVSRWEGWDETPRRGVTEGRDYCFTLLPLLIKVTQLGYLLFIFSATRGDARTVWWYFEKNPSFAHVRLRVSIHCPWFELQLRFYQPPEKLAPYFVLTTRPDWRRCSKRGTFILPCTGRETEHCWRIACGPSEWQRWWIVRWS